MSELKKPQKIKVVQLHEYEPKYPDQDNSPLESQRVKNDPKIKSKFKETQKMKVIHLHEQAPKHFFFDPTSTPRIDLQGSRKSKMTPRLSQIQKSELKESQKIKVV